MDLLEYSFELPKKFFENTNPNIINILNSYIHTVYHDECGRYYVVQYIDDMKNIYYVDDFNSKEIYYLIYLSLTISNTEIVCDLLDIYQDVNVSDFNNVLLNLACYRGQYSVISKLINAGVDVTCNNNIAIKLASLMCNNTYTYRDDDIIMILKILLDNGADIHLDNEFVLCNASHNIYVFKYLLQLDYKYDITIRDNYCLQKCVHNYFNNIINYYDKFEGQEFSSIVKSGENVLFDINKNEFVVSDVIEILLDLGADINCNNGYIINDIVKYRDKYLIELFIKYGANMSLLNVDSLLNIIKMMDCDIIKILMENGVDFSQLNNEPVKNLQKINTANLLLEIGLNLEKVFELI
ncbi:ankyrin repeat protein [Acanthamoeba polyphaga mimivirus]|uniref:Ankyrin repeat protein n=1 Tax=Acanthamoeba polyphaga mimivirus TaxID=212035 RepID=A0A2L2DKX3_MIMIV|nr:ankyrin repeat protein [Acanthamoeba polyphaga mimivirus]